MGLIIIVYPLVYFILYISGVISTSIRLDEHGASYYTSADIRRFFVFKRIVDLRCLNALIDVVYAPCNSVTTLLYKSGVLHFPEATP